jgi:hypothetical protein
LGARCDIEPVYLLSGKNISRFDYPRAWREINRVHSCRNKILTYMSIHEKCKAHLASKRLFKLEFRYRGPAEKRVVLMAPEVAKLVFPPWPDTAMGERCARLRGDLENFLGDNPVTVCWTPFRGRPYHQLGRLDPVEHGVWEIRSVDPDPAIRVLFCLAERDFMVALSCSPLSVTVHWLERPPLGPRQSAEWKRAIRECRSQWGELFPGNAPFCGGTLDECISDAIPL